jgi:hypothetical protein
MPEPITIATAITGWTLGELLKAVIPNWVSSATEKGFKNYAPRLRDASLSQKGEIPKNHRKGSAEKGQDTILDRF